MPAYLGHTFCLWISLRQSVRISKNVLGDIALINLTCVIKIVWLAVSCLLLKKIFSA